MNRSADEILARLETAIAEWNAQLMNAQQDLARHLAQAKTQLGVLADDVLGQNTGFQAVDDLARERETLQKMVEKQDEALRTAEERIAHLGQDLSAREAALKASEDRVAQFEEALLELRAEAEALARELEQVSRARNDAFRQVEKLQAKLITLRHANASLGRRPEVPGKGEKTFVLAGVDIEGQKRKLGEILVSAGVITHEQLELALAEQESDPQKRLGQILAFRGYAKEDIIAQALASQLQIPFLNPDENIVDREAAELISGRLARFHTVIPVFEVQGRVVLAMVNPLDLIAIEDVHLASGKEVDPAVATASAIESAIARCYR